MIKLQVLDARGNELFKAKGEQIETIYKSEYKNGDKIRVFVENENFVAFSPDESLPESIVYVPENIIIYEIPFEQSGVCYKENAFSGSEHKITARLIEKEEIYAERKISFNPSDLPGQNKFFPHASANYVTRNAPGFYERNAIDGAIDTSGHSGYPKHSWAGGAREDLIYKLDFGAEVEISKIDFYLRADFPHDTYWKALDVEFSDGSRESVNFEKTGEAQSFAFNKKKTTYIRLVNFKQAVFPLSWAALSQIEVFGNYVRPDYSKLEIRNAANVKDVKAYDTKRLREEFLIQNLFIRDSQRMVYSHIDRIITAGFMPVLQELKLEAGDELRADYFLQRREMGVINIGGKGVITIDGTEYEMNPRDGIYIGMGNKEISFKSTDPENPAKFYVSSCPAHKEYPIVKIDITKAKKVPCGSVEDCNKRVINQYIHPEVMKSCQLSMGLTELECGSNWNTMPCHTHDRRMEVYLYIDMAEDDIVFHMMGEPTETRHIIMKNEEAVISPSWSIHSGVGTKAYSFIWAMCGENQEFTDMDHIETKELR